MKAHDTAQARPPAPIVGLRINKLFGYFDYKIGPKPGAEDAFKRLAILYGLNGTGKTTILRLIYHILSPRERAGHKSFVAKTRFQSFQISLSDGTEVTASRPAPTDGSFTLTLSLPGAKPVVHDFLTVGKPPSIPGDQPEGPSYRHLLQALDTLGYRFYYLADDRIFSTEPEELPRRRPPGYEATEEEALVRYSSRFREQEDRQSIVEALEQAMSRLNMFVTREASFRSRKGVAFTHSVYAEVIARIVKRRSRTPRVTATSFDDQIKQLRSIAADSLVLETYGLSSGVDVEPLIKTIQGAPRNRQQIAHDLLAPYLEALNKMFRELRPLHDIIHSFVGHLNAYLSPKTVSFNVQDGLLLLSPTGDRLSAEMLSSGEKHLLLMMCSTCVATRSHTLFIIDEPEISLNVVWQRTLLQTLLDLTANSDVQFFLASHSIPLITQHRENVADLSPTGE